MKKYRKDAKVDINQPEIVRKLRLLGYSVELGKDDINVGIGGLTLWYEIKNPETACDKNGRIKKGEIKPDQVRILRSYKGHYRIVFSFKEIIIDINKQRKRLK